MMKKYKVGIISLGCAKNLVDSEMILGMLSKSNFTVVNTIEESDVIIVNTCGFIEAAKQESIENILDVCKYGKKVVVTGCLVQRYLDELKESIPEVDLWIPIRDYPQFNQKLMEILDENIQPLDPFVRMLSTPPFMAYLRISEGCNNCCAYCAIPLIRGSFRSRPFDDLIKEAKLLKEQGIKELVLISQDTTRYGNDLKNGVTIVDLLREIEKIGFVSIRLLYLYPDEISDELIDYIAQSKAVAPYFDIPFQHAANRVLKAMYRRGTHEEYDALISKIRRKIPTSVLRTTYIVGFPGETEEDFHELLEFTKKNLFDHMGAFTYSREDHTPADKYDHQVPESIKQERYNKLMEVQKKISYQKNKMRLGEVMDAIVLTKDDDKHLYSVRSNWNAPDDIDGKITVNSPVNLEIGQLVKVKITNAFVYDLFGEVIIEYKD